MYPDLTAHYFDGVHQKFHRYRIGHSLKLVRAGERVLDVGCNGGYIASFLPDCEAHGVDPSADCIAIAQTRLASASVAPAETLPFADKAMDVVVLGHILERVVDPVLVMREACRVARRLVVGSTPCSDSVMWGKHTVGETDALRAYEEDELGALLSEFGRVSIETLTLDGKPGTFSFVVEVA